MEPVEAREEQRCSSLACVSDAGLVVVILHAKESQIDAREAD
jgi:hypothetical protein